MCGIVFRRKGNVHINPHLISHRGTSFNNIEIEQGTLYHYCLPLQTNGSLQSIQPIVLSDGTIMLYNGEIFNYPKGYKNDVEYLCDLFSDPNWEKKDFYSQMDGFWAVVLIKGDHVKLFTDPLGKKQLYWDHWFNISSEIKPLLTEGHRYNKDFPLVPDATSLTPFEGVFRVPPNMITHFDLKEMTYRFDKNPYTFENKLNDRPKVVDLIERSVLSRNINLIDKNTLFVSGGLDSTIILYHIKQLGLLDNFNLITIDNGEDSKYIKTIEDFFQIPVMSVNPTEEISKISFRRDTVRYYEYPFDFGSLFQQSYLCGCDDFLKSSVIYTGDGADELFGGYKRAIKGNTQLYDIFVEIPYYHSIRLDRMGMRYTKEIRSPFLSFDLLKYALTLDRPQVKGKSILKESYMGLIPYQIIMREKEPLRNKDMREDRKEYQQKFFQLFQDIFFNT